MYVHPQHIMESLSNFWTPLWQRPTEEGVMDLMQPFLAGITQLSPIELDLSDPQLWLQAVKALKPSSGRGIDAISAAELQSLPPDAIVHLGNILSSYTEGFPEWLMIARTVALPKTSGVVLPSQIRPITILAQTYRLWSKVVCTAILRHFASVMPADITGLLKCRGPLDAAYRAQLLHELALSQAKMEGGFSLDLIKCFNTIGQTQAVALLHSLGLPSAVIQQWHASIQHLRRFWDLGTDHSVLISCTNGVPEGDTFSVVIMLAVAYAWTHSVKTAAPSTRIGAYADNWGWATAIVREHPIIFDVTVRYVRAMGMEIDWHKSWYWSTNAAHQRAIVNSLKQHTQVSVVKVSHAQDLGCTMTYHGPPRYTSVTKRFQDGKKRLTTLAAMPHPFHVKCHLAKAGVLPVVMMGVEFVPVQPATFSTFRTALADALLGASISRNSAMAVNCIPSLFDPELTAILLSLRAFKRYLSISSEEAVNKALHLLSQHSGNARQCQGPIGTLRNYLLRLGWTVSVGGLISVTGFIDLPIRHTSLREFKIWILKAWQQDLAASHSTRRAWQKLPPLDLGGTKQLLARFPPHHQVILLNEISGAYQTAVQQQAWDPNVNGSCKHCGQEDTRYHRVHQCPASSEARQPFLELLSDIEEHQLPLHELSVLFQHPAMEYIDMLHTKQIPAQPSDDLCARLNTLPFRVHCYTDGSCIHPMSPSTRYASYAVIVDLCPDDAAREAEAKQWMVTKEPPSTLQALNLSRLQGSQVIHRAELFAIVQAVEALKFAVIHTDSAYAITAVSRCRNIEHVQHLQMFDNADLLIRLWAALQQGDHLVQKIKAHCDPSLEANCLLRYHLLGNQRANDLAIWTNENLMQPLVQEFQVYHNEVQVSMNRMSSFYQLQLDLNICRAKLDTVQQQTSQNQQITTTHQRNSSLSTLQDWKIECPWQQPKSTLDLSRFSVWGRTLTTHLLQWLMQLEWPQNQDEPDVFGVTWLELVCSFWQTVGVFVPIKRQDQKGIWRMVHIHSYEQAVLFNVKWSEQAKMLSQWIDQVSDLVNTRLLPEFQRGLVRSLYTLGSGIQSSGVKVRCQFPHQHQTIQVLAEYFKTNKSQSMAILPLFQLEPQVNASTIQNELNATLDSTSKVVHQMARRVREWRKQPLQRLTF